ncbi:type II secretion system protein N [Massilia pseudoviolaceinigra]|uniref:type II secretion system protein N n=1 Tax=Massilia pseudoviolaceinigra TaxID=3057165 RepID=UPI0027963E75|nr:type II secretion system protein N [Massilia sp. CCM 9206]MDQ1921824.1 type II secretion system protein N [Massilia sp. CCM 9206]
MKRLPIVVSLIAVVFLSASIAYWAMQFFRGEQRPIVAVASAPDPVPAPDAAATLFGGQAATVVVSNYQLTGVVSAGRDSVAILVSDGQPPRALKVGKEIAPGVTVTSVFPRYITLSEGGVEKRIELATDAKAGAEMAPPMPMPQTNSGEQNQGQNQQPPPAEPPQAPGLSPEPPQNAPPSPPPPQMPAPTRTMVSPGNQPATQ